MKQCLAQQLRSAVLRARVALAVVVVAVVVDTAACDVIWGGRHLEGRTCNGDGECGGTASGEGEDEGEGETLGFMQASSRMVCVAERKRELTR